MDLKRNQITIGELLKNDRARQVLTRHFPQAVGLPIVAFSGSMTLERAIRLGSAYVPGAAIRSALAELERL